MNLHLRLKGDPMIAAIDIAIYAPAPTGEQEEKP
jgi:hypothetical protein